jgi:hypothetical protein
MEVLMSQVTVTRNDAQARFEARFKYDPHTISSLKGDGWRWDPAAKCWHTTDEAKARARGFGGEASPAATPVAIPSSGRARRFTVDTPDSVKQALELIGNRKDHFLLFDSTDDLAGYIAEQKRDNSEVRGHIDRLSGEKFVGFKTYNQTLDGIVAGDLDGVAKSDALLAKMEDVALPTTRKAWADDVCGSFANVPAFVAGHPLAMRRRIRVENEAAPLAIVVDLTTSASISADKIAKRGAAILALVRALSARRPIELWVGTGLDADNYRNAIYVFARIETAPLDLARAAHMLTCPSVPRLGFYALSRAYGYGGSWPYGKGNASFKHMETIVAPAFSHVGETLCIPAIYGTDPLVNNPEGWVRRMLQEHGVKDLAEAA